MNNLIGNFVGFDGRINRQKWWIGVVILIIVAFIINWIVGAVMGGGGMMTLAQAMDPATMQKIGWQGLIVGIILAYPYLAISIKRRHDRGNNGYDAAGLIILGLVYNLLQGLGIIGSMTMVGGVIGIVFLVYAIYILVQVGFLKGTPGPNSYGPDPLGG
jgi:uncharacterized membrane protein YhaH (DUF805 family)